MSEFVCATRILFSVRIAYIIHGIFSKINPFLSMLPKFVSCYETSAPQLCTFTPYLRVLCHSPLRKLRIQWGLPGTQHPAQPETGAMPEWKKSLALAYACAKSHVRGAASSTSFRRAAAVSPLSLAAPAPQPCGGRLRRGSRCCKRACRRSGRSCVVR